jgi:YD repeat-containing protein
MIVVSHAEGRPLRSVYPSRGLEERYRYDRDGRLTEINGAMAAVGAGGGGSGPRSLVVEHDARGPLAIRSDSHTVWERVDEPWPELLARGAREIAAGLIERIKANVTRPGIEVFALR